MAPTALNTLNILSRGDTTKADNEAHDDGNPHFNTSVKIMVAISATVTFMLIVAFVIKRFYRNRTKNKLPSSQVPLGPVNTHFHVNKRRPEPPTGFAERHFATLRNWVKPEPVKLEDVMLVNRDRRFIDMPLRGLWSPPNRADDEPSKHDIKVPQAARRRDEAVGAERQWRPAPGKQPALYRSEQQIDGKIGRYGNVARDFAERRGL